MKIDKAKFEKIVKEVASVLCEYTDVDWDHQILREDLYYLFQDSCPEGCEFVVSLDDIGI